MKNLRALAALGALGALACAPKGPRRIYAPHEVGLTLIFENPSLPESRRLEERFQVRVASSKEGPDGTLLHLKQSSLKGERDAFIQLKNGGVTYLSEEPSSTGPAPRGLDALPPRFPEGSQRWESSSLIFSLLGRAQADFPDISIPEGSRVGCWVETQFPQGHRQRSFFLPDLGEVQTMSWVDGRWVTVNRLVSRGFTDDPKPRS